MTRGSYRENDYGFGQMMLTLRSAIGLTQAGLAEMLGVSRQSVAEWEAGGKYPKFNHLQALIALAVQHHAFSTGHEAEEIRALWKASRQKVLLDERWLSQLLTSQEPQIKAVTTPPSTHHGRFHWEDALAVETFYGREWEVRLLTDWVVKQQCRVITVLGLGGIGKSALTIHFMQQVADQFEVVIWRSLRDLPTCDVLLVDLLQILVPQALSETADNFEGRLFEERLQLLMDHLRANRVLVVLDNVESVLQEGEIGGRMRPGYEGFGRFLTQTASTKHQSLILLTTRQKPDELLPHEGGGTHASVRTLRLVALDTEACEKLLSEREVVGSPSERTQLIQTYAGNPLALKIVAQTITDLFDGEIRSFLDQGGMIFGGVRDLLDKQYQRLAPLEQRIAFWMTIMREPVTLSQLQSLFVMPLPAGTVLDTMNRLYRHSLIERGQAPGSFTLQSVVLEYLTERLIAETADEILRGELDVLMQYGLEQAQVKDYIRQTQTRLLITPLLGRLKSMGLPDIEGRLHALLAALRENPIERQGYGPANLVVMLRELRGHLKGINLSRAGLRGVYLQGIDMQDTQLSGAFIQDCDFTEAFDNISSVVISANGQYWAASSITGEVRLWEAGNFSLCRIWPNTTDIIYRIALSPDGQTLVGGTANGTLKAWDTTSGTLLWTTNWPQSLTMIYRIAFSPDGDMLFCVGNDAHIRLLDSRSGMLLQLIPHLEPVSFVTWNHDGKRLATGDREGVIRLWAINETDKTEPALCTQEIAAHKGVVTGISFSPDGRVLISSGLERIGKFWDTASGQLIQTIDGHVVTLRLSPDGLTIALVGHDAILWLWDVSRGSYRAALQHTADVRNLVFTPDGQHIITSSEDGIIRVWDVKTGECLHIWKGHIAAFESVEWSPDSQQLVTGGTDHTVTVFSIEGNTSPPPPRSLYGHTDNVYSVTWSPDGRWLASAQRVQIRLWDARSGECRWVLHYPYEEENTFYELAWSPDGQRLAVGTAWNGIMIWDMKTQQFLDLPDKLPTIIGKRIVWRPDGTQIAGVGHNLMLYTWDADGKLIQQLPGHQTQLEDVDWNSGGTHIVSVGTHEIMVWDVNRGELLATIEASSNSFTGVLWAANEKVITSSIEGVLHWWNIQTGECLFERETHQGPIQYISRSWDRTRLATSGDDGSVKIWDLHTGEHLQTLRRDRLYERMDITGIRGLTDAQKATLRQLGAVETP